MPEETPEQHWLTPQDHAQRGHRRRRRSRRECAREELIRDWFGRELGAREIEARQAPEREVGAVVDDLLRRWHCDDRIVLREIVDQWPTIIGAEFAGHTQPRAIYDKVLLIDVFNTVVRPRLEYIKDKVRQRVVDLAGGEVTDIRFVVGGTTPNRPATRREKKP